MFVVVLKVTDENSRIRIHKSEVWIRVSGSASGSVPKLIGNTALTNHRCEFRCDII